MKVLVIEDEQPAADRLISMLGEVDNTVDIRDQFDTVRESVSYLRDNPSEADLLFCDIHLADGLSFEIFEQTRIDTPVIFTTAYDEYALKAFDIHSLDYLLKPVKIEHLKRAVDRFKKSVTKTERHPDTQQLLSLFQQKNLLQKKRFLVKSGNKFYHKTIDQVAFFKVDSKVVFLYDNERGSKFPTDFNLEELMDQHLSSANFFRINRKAIVNIEAVDVIKPYPNQRLSVKLRIPHTEELVVSRDRVQAFKAWFNG